MDFYHLVDHVHAGVADDHIVFIDLKKDQYFALDPQYTPFARTLVTERQIIITDSIDDNSGASAMEKEIVRQLFAQRVIQEGPATKSRRSFSTPIATRDLSEGGIAVSTEINFRTMWLFLCSLSFALFAKNILGINRSAICISRMSIKLRGDTNSDDDLNNAVYSFRRIRSFFYTSRNHCYFDCIALACFLRLNGFDAKWIFGVQMEPFKAHCWVQVEDVLASDWLGNTMFFYPILSI